MVSLIDKDPLTGMPIVSATTGENLYINEKFKISNEFIEFYLNESFLPEFYKNLDIDTLTADNEGNLGANRFILKDQVSGKNIEYFVNAQDEYEIKASSIEGKNKIYTYFIDPFTGDKSVVSISMHAGKLYIMDDGTTGEVLKNVYIDGINNFYKLRIIRNPDYDSNDPSSQKYAFDKTKYINYRIKLYHQLIGGNIRALWQMQGGNNGRNLIINNRLNLGEIPGVPGYEDAKMLLIDFYKNNSVIHEVLYPEPDFDYVPDWTGDIDVMSEIVQMADEIGFTMPILSLPRSTSTKTDYRQRVEDLYMSSFNTALYSGQYNDYHYLETDGTYISCAPSYYALLDHLNIDEQYSITEPAANIVKGQLPVACAKLSYIAKSADIEKLRFVQVNTIIKETDGIYFIDQLTTYKSASKLSRINVVKVIHRMRKDIPKILKDLLQRKETTNVINTAKMRVEKYMMRWMLTDNNQQDGIFSEINVTPYFIEEELKLVVSIAVKPIGTIEKIEVPITVY